MEATPCIIKWPVLLYVNYLIHKSTPYGRQAKEACCLCGFVDKAIVQVFNFYTYLSFSSSERRKASSGHEDVGFVRWPCVHLQGMMKEQAMCSIAFVCRALRGSLYTSCSSTTLRVAGKVSERGTREGTRPPPPTAP